MRRAREDGRWTVLVSVALIFAAYVAYQPLSLNEFVGLDDNVYITQNEHVRGGLSWEGVAWAFTTRTAGNWHPLTWLSHMLDAELYGLKPSGHHWTNWMLHVASVLILFVLLRRTTGAVWCSGFVAAVFALHPLHVESVAWAAERKDVLSGLFWMLTLATYVRYAREPSRGRYLLVVLILALGLMAKPMLVTLPFALLLLDYWPLKRLRLEEDFPRKATPVPVTVQARWLVAEKLPLFGMIVASSVVTFVVQQRGGAVEDVSLGLRLANASVSYVDYMFKVVWPMFLAVMYPYPADGLPAWKVLASVAILVCATAAVVHYGRCRRYLPVGWFWYLGTLVPVIGLVQVGYQASADRYTYIPSIGLSVVVAWGVAEIASRWKARGWWVALPACAALVAFVFMTRAQVGHWRDTFRLYEHALRVTRDNYVVQANLGVAYVREGNPHRALRHLAKAVEIKPDFDHGNYNYAVLLQREGRLDEAVKHYRRTIEAAPDYTNAHYNLGAILEQQGRRAEAIEHYRAGLDASPDLHKLRLRLARALHQHGEPAEAVVHYRKVLRGRPNDAVVHEDLARALEAQGLVEEAERHRSEARRLRSG